MGVRALLSRSDGSDQVIDLDAWQEREIKSNELLWIDAKAPDADEHDLLARKLSLGRTTLDALDAGDNTPSACVLEDGIVVTMQTLASGDVDAEPAWLTVVIGREWALTWHADHIGFIDEQHERIQDNREVGRLTPALFLVAVLHWHLDDFFEIADALEHDVDQLDEAALRGDEAELLDRLVAMRRRIARVRRILSAHRDMYSEVSRPDFLPDLEPRELDALGGVTHRLERANEAIANAREMLLGTFDVHMTRTAQRTNDIMRLLTWVTVILLPAGVLAGVMGMNFQVGFFDNPGLFWLVVVSMLVVASITLGVARWRHLL